MRIQQSMGGSLLSNMLLPNLISLIDVTFSTPTPGFTNYTFSASGLGSGRVALTGDVRSESARYCLHQQERADTCQSDVKVLKKNLSAKPVIDYSTKEHA